MWAGRRNSAESGALNTALRDRFSMSGSVLLSLLRFAVYVDAIWEASTLEHSRLAQPIAVSYQVEN